MKKEFPKVLVCTVGPWSDTVGSNTMSELFRDYPKDKLACLYIRADVSNSDVCHRYFHIYEGRVMKTLYKRGVITGEEYLLGEKGASNKDAEQEKARYDSFRRKSNWFYLFAREWVWMLGKWKSKELDGFLKKFNPDIVVLPIESYIHFNRINEYIIKKCKPQKVISYLWDDNFTYKQYPNSLGYKSHRWWLRHSVKRLLKKSSTIFSICPKMKREVDAEYGINSVLLTKPIYQFNEVKKSVPTLPIKILYTGKLIYGRDETIAEIVEALKNINKDGQKALLQIYTNTELSQEMKGRICVDGCCEIKGFVHQDEAIRIQKEADVLLYAEGLSNTNLVARLSFSTKMTDYLASGNCIWAVGNMDLAPIEYLKVEDAGIVSTDRASIWSSLQQIVEKPNMLKIYAEKAQLCGIRNHNKETITERVNAALLE